MHFVVHSDSPNPREMQVGVGKEFITTLTELEIEVDRFDRVGTMSIKCSAIMPYANVVAMWGDRRVQVVIEKTMNKSYVLDLLTNKKIWGIKGLKIVASIEHLNEVHLEFDEETLKREPVEDCIHPVSLGYVFVPQGTLE